MNKILNAVSLLGAVFGSTLVASNTGLTTLGYACFFMSSLAAVVLLLQTKNAPWGVLVQNVFFIFINAVGFFRYL